MSYYGDIRLGDSIDIKFTTRQISGAPFTLAGTPVISAYVGNGTTEITAGITLTVDFDTRTGLNNVRVVASSGNGFATATNVELVITTGTVNSVSVVGEVIGSFSIENRSALMPTTAARTLDVATTGEAGLDFANVNLPAGAIAALGIIDNGTAQAATGTTLQLRAAAAFASSEPVGSVIVITGGTAGVGQVRQITAYNGGTDTATVDTWTTTPTGTITYAVFAAPPAATGTLPAVNVTQWNGSAVSVPTVAGVPNVNAKTWNDLATVALPLTPTVAGRALDVSAGGEAGLDWANIGSPTTAVNLSATNIDVDQVVASVSGAVGSVTGAVGSVTGNVGGNVTGSVGTVNALAANVITAAATAADFTTEIQAGLSTLDAAGVRTAVGLASANLDTQIGTLATASSLATVAGYVDTEVAAIKAKTDNLPADPADASDIAAAFSTVNGTLATVAGYIDTEVAAIKATTDKLDQTLTNSSDGYIFTAAALQDAPVGAGGTPPTAAEIADAVWEEAIADHSGTSGSTAEALNAAGAAGDPWITALPGAYSAGQAGYIVGTNINATVGSRATQTSVDDLPTNAELATALAAADDAVLAILGTPAGASLAADVAAVKSDTAAILVDTAEIGTAGAGLTALATQVSVDDLPTNGELATALAAADDAVLAAIDALPTAVENADALLDRNMATGTDSGSPTVRTPRQALRILRNKWSIDSDGLQTITKEDDATASWTQQLASDASANPVTGTDPAGP